MITAIVSFAMLAATPPVARVQDLGKPGALQALAATNPDHHRKAVRLLRAASEQRCEEEFRMLRVQLDAREARCGALLRTSYPAKRDVRFTLDEVAYRAVVTIDPAGYRLQRVPGR